MTEKLRFICYHLGPYNPAPLGVMKFTCNLRHIDLTFYTIFIPRVWFQVSGFGCQERSTQQRIMNTDTRNLTPK